MVTITLIIAIAVSLYLFAAVYMLKQRVDNLSIGLRECAQRTSSTKLKLETLDNKVNKPKRKPGRPKKNVKPKVVHQLNGKQ